MESSSAGGEDEISAEHAAAAGGEDEISAEQAAAAIYSQLASLPARVRDQIMQQIEAQTTAAGFPGGDDTEVSEAAATTAEVNAATEEGGGSMEAAAPPLDPLDWASVSAYNQTLLYQRQQEHYFRAQQQYMAAQQTYLVTSTAFQQAMASGAPMEEQHRTHSAMMAAALAQQSILTKHKVQQALFKVRHNCPRLRPTVFRSSLLAMAVTRCARAVGSTPTLGGAGTCGKGGPGRGLCLS